ncbi:hypothetical protein CHUAL_004104 [Chamberlinius hualienensis]
MQHPDNTPMGAGQQYNQYEYNQVYDYNAMYSENSSRSVDGSVECNEHKDRDYRREKEPDRFERRRGNNKDEESNSDYNYYNDNNYTESASYSHRSGNTHSGDECSYDGSNDSKRDRETYPKREMSWKEETPHHTIMLRGLPAHISENDIRCEVFSCGLEVKDVRLLRKRDTGVSRGFAFVEFKDVTHAVKWMEMKQGAILLQDRFQVTMHYSIPKDGVARDASGSGVKVRYDWDCIKCGAHNFRRRDFCYMCSASREGADQAQFSDGYEEYSATPRSTLLFRNLDVLTTEDKVLGALQEVTTLPIKNIRVAKDTLTGTSRGFCYVDLNSTSEAVILHDRLQSLEPPLEVDGKIVYVSYAKQSLSNLVSATSATVASTAMAAAQWTNQIPTGANVPAYGIPQQSYSGTTPVVGAAVVANMGNVAGQTATDTVATVSAQSAVTYQQQYYAPAAVNYVQAPGTAGAATVTHLVGMPTATVAVVGAAATTNPVQLTNAAVSYQLANNAANVATPQVAGVLVAPTIDTANIGVSDVNGEYQKYPIPDASTYQYDATTGYYYDSTSGLYYDANSQYYYNGISQKFLYWDSEKQTYIPANSTDGDDGLGNSQSNDGTSKKRDKQDKVKIAKKIAKDMERWAKTLNQKKENAKQGIVANQSFAPDSLSKQAPTADAGFAILEQKTTLAERQAAVREAMKQKESEDRKLGVGKKSGLVAAYGEGSESDEDAETGNPLSENRLTDWVKMACLLCKRQFSSKEALQRHQQLSDLHKENYEKLKASVISSQGDDGELRYRDRAKERRERYGEPEIPPILKNLQRGPNQPKAVDYEQPTKHGIDSSNIGNQMLKAMGWNEGQGLGRSNQGRVDIVEAQKRTSTAGLGMRGSTYGATAGDTYKDTIKKMMQVRYNEDEG